MSFVIETPGGQAVATVTVDETVRYGDWSVDTFESRFQIDRSESIIISSGIDTEYLDGEYGYFLPSTLTVNFACQQILADAVAMQWFRDAVTSLRIELEGNVLFDGAIDRNSVSYDFSSMTISAGFCPFVRPDRDVKTAEGTVDSVLFSTVFGVDYGIDTGTDLDWVRVRYVVEKMLTHFGASSVTFGNFNRLFSSVILADIDLPSGSYATSGAAGWDGSDPFETWLSATAPNVIFDRLLIYKAILMQDDKYNGIGVSTLLDIVTNLCNEIGAVMGITPAGVGYCIPTYGGAGTEQLGLTDIIDVKIEGYMEKSPGLVAAGLVYPQDGYGDDAPIVSFVPGVSTFGAVRYDENGTHYGAYYAHTTVWVEPIYSIEPIKVMKYMHNPVMGSIPAGVGIDGFGYSASTGVTHSGDLKAVKYIGAEDFWLTDGTNWYLDNDASAIVSMATWYYSLFRVDREKITITLSGVGYSITTLYQLPERYGSIKIRVISIDVDLTAFETLITGVAIGETPLIRPTGSTGESGTGGSTGGAVTIEAVNTYFIATTSSIFPPYAIPVWTVRENYISAYGTGITGLTGGIPPVATELFAQYKVIIRSSGTYVVWIKHAGKYRDSGLVHSGDYWISIDGSTEELIVADTDYAIVWANLGTAVMGVGEHDIKIYRRSGSVNIYQIYLTKNGDTPS